MSNQPLDMDRINNVIANYKKMMSLLPEEVRKGLPYRPEDVGYSLEWLAEITERLIKDPESVGGGDVDKILFHFGYILLVMQYCQSTLERAGIDLRPVMVRQEAVN